jgi:hypothetical protein
MAHGLLRRQPGDGWKNPKGVGEVEPRPFIRIKLDHLTRFPVGVGGHRVCNARPAFLGVPGTIISFFTFGPIPRSNVV